MQREIKFRLWDKHRKIMFYEGEQLPECDELYCDDWTMFWSRLKILQNDYILMQYTNLKDKDGREIFEGDKVLIGYNRLGVVEVQFQNGGYNVSKFDLSKVRVIGDIYTEDASGSK